MQKCLRRLSVIILCSSVVVCVGCGTQSAVPPPPVTPPLSCSTCKPPTPSPTPTPAPTPTPVHTPTPPPCTHCVAAEYQIPTASSGAYDMTSGTDGNLW